MLKQNILILLLAVLAVSALILTRKPRTQNSIPNATTQARLGAVNNLGRTAPDFQLRSLDGKQIRLSDYRGKAVLLNFWATWCGPCKIEMPWFVELQKQYRANGFEVLGVAMESSPQRNRRVRKEAWVELHDSDGE